MIKIVCDRCHNDIPENGINKLFFEKIDRKGFKMDSNSALAELNIKLSDIDICDDCAEDILDIIIANISNKDEKVTTAGLPFVDTPAADVVELTTEEKEKTPADPTGTKCRIKMPDYLAEKDIKTKYDYAKVNALRSAGWSWDDISIEFTGVKQNAKSINTGFNAFCRKHPEVVKTWKRR